MREMASPTSSAPGSHILSLSLSLRNETRLEQDSRASRGNKNANQVSRGPINPADSRSSSRSALVDEPDAELRLARHCRADRSTDRGFPGGDLARRFLLLRATLDPKDTHARARASSFA